VYIFIPAERAVFIITRKKSKRTRRPTVMMVMVWCGDEEHGMAKKKKTLFHLTHIHIFILLTCSESFLSFARSISLAQQEISAANSK